eukprot:jgi/Orpsp1_1/1190570/evm.model.d7180000079831.2
MKNNRKFNKIYLLIIIFLIKNVISQNVNGNVDNINQFLKCKSCEITNAENDILFGSEKKQTCIIDKEQCKEYLNMNYCVGYTIMFKYMDISYGKEFNKTCMIDPKAEEFPICKGCIVKREENYYSWGVENDTICLVDLYNCKPKTRTYPYYIFIINFGLAIVISWGIAKII